MFTYTVLPNHHPSAPKPPSPSPLYHPLIPPLVSVVGLSPVDGTPVKRTLEMPTREVEAGTGTGGGGTGRGGGGGGGGCALEVESIAAGGRGLALVVATRVKL